MKCFVGLGSNLGERKKNLENAARALKTGSRGRFRVSPIFINPAVVFSGAPPEWRKAFLNAVVELDWPGTAAELLAFLKQIESELGRIPSERWAPRLIDLDLLSFGQEIINSAGLTLPHPLALERAFVLAPLLHLQPSLKWPSGDPDAKTVLQLSRDLTARGACALPIWMGILNLTSDSFSDGGQLQNDSSFESRIQTFESEEIQIFDLGAESTRPQVKPNAVVTPEMEWQRLKLRLEFLKNRYKSKIFKPSLSVDTYHTQTARLALASGANLINDVSGLSDLHMLEVLKAWPDCQYVLMHSLTVPADSEVSMKTDDVVASLKDWCRVKMDLIKNSGIHLDRIIFDPGLGFGKTLEQSAQILERVREFQDLPLRILIGHSRKRFLNPSVDAVFRDPETLGTSLQLAQSGVEILRVHETSLHTRALQSFNAAKP